MKTDRADGVTGQQANPVAGKRVLIVEDEVFVGLMLREDLQSAGADVTGPLTGVDEALDVLGTETFDAALLDVNLRGEMSFPVADKLMARKVPFVFVTGYGDDAMPRRFKHSARLAKPYDPKSLRDVLARILEGPGLSA